VLAASSRRSLFLVTLTVVLLVAVPVIVLIPLTVVLLIAVPVVILVSLTIVLLVSLAVFVDIAILLAILDLRAARFGFDGRLRERPTSDTAIAASSTHSFLAARDMVDPF
jgi:hypothetical protein